jgi:circadian clock protein KaiC
MNQEKLVATRGKRSAEDNRKTPAPQGGRAKKKPAQAAATAAIAPPARIESGIPRLDFILKGGFFPGGMYTLYGPPGAGKTIMANQLCFNLAARTGECCVYVTVLAESHSKMVQHLSGLKFFDAQAVGKRVKYIAGYQTLKADGLKGLLDLLRATVLRDKPRVLVIDGLESVEQAVTQRLDTKEFLHQLQAFTALAGTTTLLCAVEQEDAARRDENAMVDGVIELSDHLIGPRAVRELTVHKFRGSGYLRGRHEVEITDGGVQIHPRTEIQFDAPPERATEERERMAFGIRELDRMMGGGILSGSTLALLGAPGSGKTTLGLSFLVEGAKRGHKGIYFGFYEPPPRLLERAEAIGIPLRKYVDEGMIELIWQPPLEHFMDSLAESLLERIRAQDHARRRLFIDGVQGFEAAAVYGDRMPRFLSALTNQLRTWDVTTMISEELPLFGSQVEMPNPELANVVETVLLLRYVELRSQLHRLISIMKMRESPYDTSIREFSMDKRGIVVAGSFKSAEAILSGFARERGGPK